MDRREGSGHDEPVRAATRLTRARLADVRLWGGLGLIAVAVAAGAVLVGGEEESVAVWRATRDLSSGTAVGADGGLGIEVVQVSRAVAGDGYAGPGNPVAGVLRWPVTAGELLPVSAVAEPGRVPTRLVTVPVDPMHAPVGLQAGDRVDAWVTPDPDRPVSGTELAPESSTDPGPWLVLPSATVAAVTDAASALSGEVGVVLAVPEAVAPAVVAATRSGVIDLVAVPVSSQDPR